MAHKPRLATFFSKEINFQKIENKSYLLSEELDLAVLHLETFLDQGGQLANTLSLLAKNILGAGGQDDDLGTLGGDADLDTGITVLGQFL